MREIIIKAYQFNELSDKAKEKARQWFREGNDGADGWECIKEDAANVGLKIVSLPLYVQGMPEGELIWDALEVAEEIIREHGPACDTHQTALCYLPALKKENDENLSDEREKAEHEFLNDLLEDYRVMLQKVDEYQNSDKYVDETIEANEYEFTEEGKRI